MEQVSSLVVRTVRDLVVMGQGRKGLNAFQVDSWKLSAPENAAVLRLGCGRAYAGSLRRERYQGTLTDWSLQPAHLWDD